MTSYKFHETLRVRFNETDLQGHVNFAWYLNYFDVALTGYLRALGYSYQQLLADGLDMFYVDAHAVYRAPSYFDQALRVHCRIGHVGNTSLRFDFQIIADDGQLVTTGEITAVMGARGTQEKVRVPDRLRQAIAAYEGVEVEGMM